MACQHCVRALETGAMAIFELVHFHGDDLPPGTDWVHVSEQVRDLSRHFNHKLLERGGFNGGNSQGVDGHPGEIPG